MGETYLGAFKSTKIGFLIMGETYLGAFESDGIVFTPFLYVVYLSRRFEKR